MQSSGSARENKLLPGIKRTTSKLQAPSVKHQATLNQNLVQVLKRQATSIKRQAASIKLRPQATSYKLRDP